MPLEVSRSVAASNYNKVTNSLFFQENFEFDINRQDVMVFLHIQKTGGTTFGKHLVEDLDLERDCECHKGRLPDGRKKKLRCNCFRPGKGTFFKLQCLVAMPCNNVTHFIFSTINFICKKALHFMLFVVTRINPLSFKHYIY